MSPGDHEERAARTTPGGPTAGAPLHELDATELAARIRRGDVSPVAVVAAHLERMEQLDPHLHAIVTTADASAREAARRAERAVRDGRPLGPLHGVPFTVKDSIDTAGVRTTRGSRLFLDHVPAADATAVARLKAAGAILIAKTSLPEFAAWWESDNDIVGTTRNPWDLERTAGGSSGGEAAAIASGMSPLGLGSDVGISVRGPAHLTGIVALKPTHGRIPLTGHWPAAPRRMWHLGPMARSVRDVATALDVLRGADASDGHAAQPAGLSAPGTPGAGRPLRVGWLARPGFGPIDPDIARAVEEAGETLASFGSDVAPTRIPALEADDFTTVGGAFFAAEFGPAFAAAVRGREDELHPIGRAAALRDQPPIDRYMEAERKVSGLRDAFAAYFSEHDLLLCPVMPFVAPLPGRSEQTVDGETVGAAQAMRATIPFNLTGLPAVAVPFRLSASGLPIGVQLVARWWDEATLLSAAALLETASDLRHRHPRVRAGDGSGATRA
jgi:aspartyl-tRNA(Asn)/glutamyl-tRNA(Gln) amidotransferase subunit A